MCDIYYEPCKVCGKLIEMHLGSYATNRFEITVFCNECLEEREWYPEGNGDTLWNDEKRNTLVVALTTNAKINRKINHPNQSPVNIVEEK